METTNPLPPETVTKEPVAIVGLGCVLPDAPDVPSFWANLMAGRSSIREVRPERWEPELFWDADRSAPGKTYAKIGAFVEDDAFNGVDYRMPPKVVEQVDPSQRWALSATREALLDAGYATGLKADFGKARADGQALREFDRTRCAVILGNAMGGEQMKLQAKNTYWPQIERALRTDPDFQTLPADKQEAALARVRKTYQQDAPPITEDSMPGTLSNVAAGRIANVFDLSGKNFTTDAACASSLAALDAAIDSLRRRESDLVVWGGTDRSMDVTPYVEFSKIGALSADGSRPFDKDANGFVMGEGCAILLLKRLSDAERDGDTVYAVVRGVGASSDGKGKGITAPNPVGQVKAVARAYEDAAVDPATLGYIEAHGTSTPVGDPVELEAAAEAFSALGATPARGSIAVGSVKSNLGHLKSAAGAVGMLKAVLSLHHGKLPPSINVRTANPRIDWAASPFKIQTDGAEWPQPAAHPRRAAVSSFGFGGTNFHVVLEAFVRGHLRVEEPVRMASRAESPGTVSTRPGTLGTHGAPAAQGPAGAQASPAPVTFDAAAFREHMATAATLEAEALVLSESDVPKALALAEPSFATTGDGPRLRELLQPLTTAGVAADRRVAFHVASVDDISKKLATAQKAMTNPAAARLAFNQGVYLGTGTPQGKVAFLFPGQGTQYVNMGRDLADKYAVVRNTFEEADKILVDELDGVRLTDILWPTPDTKENRAACEKRLQLTEFTQPAVLAMDVAVLRLLGQWGIEPDVVAGHSLGEYGALVAAGVLSFADALHAVAARGREMAHVEVPDLGKMASISGDWHAVEAALAAVDGYVICANKNCPSQTVIAGSTTGVEAAVAALQEQGLQCMMLPVSAAFHSKIVAPASEPLRRVLGRLDVQPPKTRVISNVGAAPYPQDPDAIRDNLAVQVASPVEWIGTIERMYQEGVRTFIEVGPKRALTGFVADILADKKDMRAAFANHPKKGGIPSINELFAFLGAHGLGPHLPDLDDAAVYTASFRDPTAPFRHPGRAAASPSAPLQPAEAGRAAGATPPAAPGGTLTDDVLTRIGQQLSSLGAELAALRVQPGAGSPSAPAAPRAADQAATPPAAAEADGELRERIDALGLSLDDIGIAGISIGLPGIHKPLFDDGDWDRILAGENLIDAVSETERSKMVDKHIVRLVKGKDGQATFQPIHDMAQVIHLAGRRGDFDLAAWGVPADLSSVLDRTSQYALAAGLEALRDAGIPLQRTYIQTSTGGHLPKEWKLPAPLRDDTGIIFASAFPGYDRLVSELSRHLADRYAGRSLDDLHVLYNELITAIQDEGLREGVQRVFDEEFARLQDVLPGHGAARYEFNRKFLFEVLSMGHSQLAQFLGARGPNTQVNAACASTTQAIAIAEDWIRTGRCRRVLVVGADDATSPNLLEWIGSGFLASGAATTQRKVEDAALPFDARRHGMIIGMGAVGLLVEAVPETEARGMRPIARLLATQVSNSAFHGSRLDIEHIADEMNALMSKARRRHGVAAADIAPATVFMSHETYTPARGGSAAAEIHALRAAFGDDASRLVIANTKGFTGHPQGAGIEDAVALKCLQRGTVPPIPNLKQPDPELGDLNLSKGGAYDVRYALRLAAGFGSQVAMTLTELVAREDQRVADDGAYGRWLAAVTGIDGAKTEVVHRTLRVMDAGPPARRPAEPMPVAAPDASAVPMPAPASVAAVPRSAQAAPPALSAAAGTPAGMPVRDDVLAEVTRLVAEKTGYPVDLLEADLDLEADLGIDTVKQAELFSELRDRYVVPMREDLQLKDYNTLRKVAQYMGAGANGASPAGGAESAPAAAQDAGSGADVLAQVVALVAEKTGYPVDLLEPDLDLEADLGIDTVKQAELFGEFRARFDVPMREDLQLKDYNTLRKVAGYMAENRGSGAQEAAPRMADGDSLPGAGPAPPPAHTAPAAAAAPLAASSAPGSSEPATPGAADMPQAADEDAVLADVVELVAAKTGYPADLLEPDLDLEADLGIDTVKQAELFGEFRARFDVPVREDLQLKDYNTLRKVAAYMAAHAGSGQAAVPAGDAVGSIGAVTIRRLVPALRDAALPDEANAIPLGPWLVLGDPDAEVLGAWRDAGFQVIGRGADATDDGGNGAVDGVAGLLAWATRPGALTPADLFAAAKAHATSLEAVVVVTAQDGAHGLLSPRDPDMAGLAGAAKALRKELPDAIVKAVDLDPAGTDAGLVVDEVKRGGPRTEVCYAADGRRRVVDVAPEPLAAGPLDVAGKTFVVSGGAQGITAELLAAMAPQGPNLLLLGRTAVADEAGTWAAWSDDDWKAEEAGAIDALKADGQTPTPVKIKKRIDAKRKAAEVYRNVQRLHDAGAKVLYRALDVTDAAAVAEAVAEARERFGSIDGVIHAAGVEVSKALVDKPRDQFDLVYAIKRTGIQALLDATDTDDLSWLVGFGSVAGRFGNVGQVDYSAANEAMAKAIAAAGRDRGIRTAFTVSWGPWAEIGMATRGSIMTVLKASGVDAIPTEDGTRLFLAEMAAPSVRECVVAGALGALDVDGQVVATPVPGADEAPAATRSDAAPTDTPPAAADPAATGPARTTSTPAPALERAQARLEADPDRFRLLSDIVAVDEGRSVTAVVTMDRARDPYPDDHAIDGVPLMPGVFGLEAFAEAARLLAPDADVLLGARDVRFRSPLKQHKQDPARADVEVTAGPEGQYACRLTSRFVGPDGMVRGGPRVHFEATLLFGTAPDALTTREVPTMDGSVPRDRIYPPFFHGPSFQVLASAGPVDGAEATATWARPATPAFADGARFLSHPFVVEGLFQLCGLHTLEQESIMSLPAAIEALDVFPVPLPDRAVLWCTADGRTADGLRRFDAAACTEDGQVLVRLRGYAMVDLGPASRKAVPAGPAEDAVTADDPGSDGGPAAATVPEATVSGAPSSEAARAAAADAIQAAHPGGDGPILLPEMDGLVFAAVRVPHQPPVDDERLTAKERDQVSGFAAPKRACEWAAGRLAVKDAVRRIAPELGDGEVTVAQDPGTGEPILMVRGQRSPARISITHRDGLAVAAVSDDPIGIDLETVEARSAAFLEQAFRSSERDHLASSGDRHLAAACAWAAKEAALKRHGSGLRTSLYDVTVDLAADGARVDGPFGSFGVRFFDVAGRVLAVTGPTLDPMGASVPPAKA